MKGMFYAPLLGIAMLLMAAMLLSTTTGIERQNKDLITHKLVSSLYFTYAEIAPWDVRALLEAYVRKRVYESLNYLFSEEVVDYVRDHFGEWLNDFVGEYSTERVRLRLISPGSISVKELGKDYLEIDVEGGALEVEVGSKGERIITRVAIPRRFLIPFPVGQVKEMKRGIEEAEEVLKEINDTIKSEEFEEIEEDKVPTPDAIDRIFGGKKFGPRIKYESVEGCVLDGFGSLSTKKFIRRVWEIFSGVEGEWRVPGLSVAPKVFAHKEVGLALFSHTPLVIHWGGKTLIADLKGIKCEGDAEGFIKRYLCRCHKECDKRDRKGRCVKYKCICGSRYKKLNGFCRTFGNYLKGSC